MSINHHSLSELFEQLGLDGSDHAIQTFVKNHKIKDNSQTLGGAPFWNENQSNFIRESWGEDSDWATAVDELDNLLRD